MSNVELYRRTIDRDATFEHVNRRDHSLHEEPMFVPMRRDEAPTATPYSGYFALRYNDGVVTMLDTDNVRPGISGQSDIGDVPILETSIYGGDYGIASVYLNVEYSNNKYIFSLSKTSGKAYWLIGEIRYGVPYQIWQNGYIYWGSRYFI